MQDIYTAKFKEYAFDYPDRGLVIHRRIILFTERVKYDERPLYKYDNYVTLNNVSLEEILANKETLIKVFPLLEKNRSLCSGDATITKLTD